MFTAEEIEKVWNDYVRFQNGFYNSDIQKTTFSPEEYLKEYTSSHINDNNSEIKELKTCYL